MRALLQRVSEAAVSVAGEEVAAIGPGLLVLVCAVAGDAGKMNRSVRDVGGAVLAVSQFTLAADLSRGNRPGFSRAAPPDEGERLYGHFCQALRAEGVPVETGVFGAEMAVRLVNDGPVTIWMDTRER
jgi:D-tyrosyl-tRNA(Tyr) deacylase